MTLRPAANDGHTARPGGPGCSRDVREKNADEGKVFVSAAAQRDVCLEGMVGAPRLAQLGAGRDPRRTRSWGCTGGCAARTASQPARQCVGHASVSFILFLW